MISPTQPDAIYQAFANKGPAISAALVGGATDLFAALAVIELVWLIGWSVAHKSDVFDMMIVVTRFAIMAGFWFWITQNWVAMAKAVLDTFGLWGNAASQAAGGSANMSPVNFLTAGLDLAHHIWAAMTIGEPITSALLLFAGIIDAVIFGLVAAMIMLVVIEAMFASYLGVVLVAFGGNSFTRDFAYSPIRYAISVGVKRMTLQLIAGVSQGIVTGWSNLIVTGVTPDWSSIGVMITVPIIMLTLALIAPKIAQDCVMGTHLSAGAGIIASARGIASAAVVIGTSLAGASAALAASAQLAGKQMAAKAAAGGQAAGSGLLGQQAAAAAKQASMAAGNIAGAFASDIGKRLTGQYGGAHGYRGFRMAAEMSQQGKELEGANP